jgi:hypothetical protein
MAENMTNGVILGEYAWVKGDQEHMNSASGQLSESHGIDHHANLWINDLEDKVSNEHENEPPGSIKEAPTPSKRIMNE